MRGLATPPPGKPSSRAGCLVMVVLASLALAAGPGCSAGPGHLRGAVRFHGPSQTEPPSGFPVNGQVAINLGSASGPVYLRATITDGLLTETLPPGTYGLTLYPEPTVTPCFPDFTIRSWRTTKITINCWDGA